jgi:hypothetical protein
MGRPSSLRVSHPDEISPQLSDYGQCVQQHPASWARCVVYGPADAEIDLAGGDFVGDGSGARH